MSPKKPPRPAPTKEDRLAKALRDNLARRKALVRAKRERAKDGGHPPPTDSPESNDASS